MYRYLPHETRLAPFFVNVLVDGGGLVDMPFLNDENRNFAIWGDIGETADRGRGAYYQPIAAIKHES
mgnify:CR=1 FL=1